MFPLIKRSHKPQQIIKHIQEIKHWNDSSVKLKHTITFTAPFFTSLLILISFVGHLCYNVCIDYLRETRFLFCLNLWSRTIILYINLSSYLNQPMMSHDWHKIIPSLRFDIDFHNFQHSTEGWTYNVEGLYILNYQRTNIYIITLGL